MFYAGTFTVLGVTPILHWRHGNDSRAVASGLGRVVAIASGTFIAIGQGHTTYLDPAGFLYVAIPMVGLQIVDAIVFPIQKIHSNKSVANLVVLPVRGGGTVGLGGTF